MTGAAFAVYLVACPAAIEPLYGDWSSQFLALEAGAVGQLLEMAAYDLRLGLCQVGKLEDEKSVLVAAGADEDAYVLTSLVGGILGASTPDATEPPGVDLAAVRAHLQQRLPAYMANVRLSVLSELPLTSTGKVDRQALERAAGAITTRTSVDGDIVRRVAELVESVTGRRAAPGTALPALGLDSLNLVRLRALLEREFARQVPLATLMRAVDLQDLALAVMQERPQ